MKRPARNHPARVHGWIEIDRRKHWALFDSGAVQTYVVRSAADELPVVRLPRPMRRGLAGRGHRITDTCWLHGLVEGYAIRTDALVVERLLDDEDGRPVEILVGMEAMQAWGIGLDIQRKRLDFTRYRREATEA